MPAPSCARSTLGMARAATAPLIIMRRETKNAVMGTPALWSVFRATCRRGAGRTNHKEFNRRDALPPPGRRQDGAGSYLEAAFLFAVDFAAGALAVLFLAAGFLAAGFLAGAFFGAAFFLPPFLPAFSVISATAMSTVTSSGSTSLGRVALTFSHLT